jgi:hypothetical protein
MHFTCLKFSYWFFLSKNLIIKNNYRRYCSFTFCFYDDMKFDLSKRRQHKVYKNWTLKGLHACNADEVMITN